MTDTIASWQWARLKNSFEAHWADLLAGHEALNVAETHWIALSGGADSVALLQLLAGLPAALRPKLQVVHVNHGLSPSASAWASFCERITQAAQLPFHLRTASRDDAKVKALGVEAWAREARYAAIAELIEPGDIVHCAQHQDDQAETLLLALMRGSGPDGQAAMPLIRQLGSGWLCRPVLQFRRAELTSYALETQGEWIDDESNRDLRFDRNFLRSAVVPALSERWPAATRSLSRAATIAAESSEANRWFATDTLKRFEEQGACFINPKAHQFSSSWLSIAAIERLPKPVRNQLLRVWMTLSGLPTLPFSKIGELDRSILCSDEEKSPYLRWDETVALWRYANRIWVFRLQETTLPKVLKIGDEVEFAGGILRLEPSGNGFRLDDCQSIQLTQRGGGERFKKSGAAHSTQLKKYLNEQRVLPWCRELVPLAWNGDELVAIAGLWQKSDGAGWRLAWLPEGRLTAQ